VPEAIVFPKNATLPTLASVVRNLLACPELSLCIERSMQFKQSQPEKRIRPGKLSGSGTGNF